MKELRLEFYFVSILRECSDSACHVWTNHCRSIDAQLLPIHMQDHMVITGKSERVEHSSSLISRMLWFGGQAGWAVHDVLLQNKEKPEKDRVVQKGYV